MEERRSLIDDLLFKKMDSGRAQEGENLDLALNKRLKEIGTEFRRVEGEEVKFLV